MDEDRRLELHDLLLLHVDNCYFQPPSDVSMDYPCIVYRRMSKDSTKANNKTYFYTQGYSLTVIDRDPDTDIPSGVLENFAMSEEETTYTIDNLHHTSISLYY